MLRFKQIERHLDNLNGILDAFSDVRLHLAVMSSHPVEWHNGQCIDVFDGMPLPKEQIESIAATMAELLSRAASRREKREGLAWRQCALL